MIYFVIGVLFVLLILVHEYGHFLAAKKNGVEVEEFGVGFPPKIAGKTMGRGIFRGYYTLNLLPLGGFVKMKGENEADKSKGSFGAASYPKKVLIIAAGILMNLVAAAVILTILAWFGMPQVVENQFKIASDSEVVYSKVLAGQVGEGSPASEAGVEFGDEIISMAGEPIEFSEQMFDITKENAGQEIDLVYISRRGEEVSTKVQLIDVSTITEPVDEEDESKKGNFGVSPTKLVLERSTWSAPIVGIGVTLQLTWQTITGVFILVSMLFSGDFVEAGDQTLGPVGIVALLKDVSIIGFELMFFFVAFISVILAVMNSLPIPALDGGRLFVSGVFKIIKRPLTPKLENSIHGIGFVVLVGLLLVVSFNDIQRFF